MKEKGKWTPHIIAATALVVFIVLGLACAFTTPFHRQFSSTDISAKEQSVIYTWKAGWPKRAYISSIDNKVFRSENNYDFILLAPGQHEIGFNYYRLVNEREVGAKVYAGYSSYTMRYVESKTVFLQTINFISGHYYAIIGGDSLQDLNNIPDADIRAFLDDGLITYYYCVIDFTTDDFVITWSTNDDVAKEIAEQHRKDLKSTRRGIEKEIKKSR